MAVKVFDDFTGKEMTNGWVLRNAKGMEFHVQNLSGLLRALAFEATKFGADDDRAFQKIAEVRVSKKPQAKGKTSG